MAGRRARAREEVAAAVEYDYGVVDGDLAAAVRAVHAVPDAEGRRTDRHRDVQVLLDRLRTEVSAELDRLAPVR